jgi:hypothetical protein
VEEAKVESIRKDKAATEKALQESVERCQVELASQKEYYSKALMEAKDAAALAEARVDSEARAGVERLLLEATERETSLVQTIEELRESLTRMEKQVLCCPLLTIHTFFFSHENHKYIVKPCLFSASKSR